MANAELLDARDIRPNRLDRWLVEPPPPSEPASQPGSFRDFRRLLARFEPISLAEMDQVALLDRIDTKYVMSVAQLYSALASLPEHYRVLNVNGTRLNRYRTLYFDTDHFDLYMCHHRGKRIRYKVRSRQYVDTNQSYLEVKWKGKRGRTVKDRIRTNDFVTQWGGDVSSLMNSRLSGEAQSLAPKISNEFYRITLVSKRYKERVTLDLGLEFRGEGRLATLPDIAIAEVKQDGVNRASDFVRRMRTAGIRPGGFSKYCMGVSMLYQDVKHNRFKPNLRLISKLMGGDYDA